MKFLEPLLEQLDSMWVGFIKVLPMLGIGLIVLIITWAISKLAGKISDKVFSKGDIRPSLKSLFHTLIKIAVWTIGIIVTATIVFPSLTPAKMLAALGLGSVAVGFAFKDVFENFLAGVLIMLRKPMRIGDFIECEGVAGKIEEITIRDTYVRQVDNVLVLVPNAHLFKNPVQILTDEQMRRYQVIVGVAYGEDVDESREVITNALQGIDGLSSEKPVEVFAREFADSSINFTVRWWAESKPLDMHQSRDKVVAAIKRALDDKGIEIPFPYRTLTFAESLKIDSLKTDNQIDDNKSTTTS